MDEKRKIEIKMFIWYLATEPWRKIKNTLKTVDDTITPDFLMIFYLILAAALFIRNRNDPKWILLAAIIIFVLLRSSWKKKRFIHQYRKQHYSV